MSVHGDDVDFGNTVAGWTGTAVSFTGFCLAGGAMVAASPAAFWAGLALAAGGGLAGLALRRFGWGKPDGPRPAPERHWRAARTAHLAARSTGTARRADRADLTARTATPAPAGAHAAATAIPAHADATPAPAPADTPARRAPRRAAGAVPAAATTHAGVRARPDGRGAVRGWAQRAASGGPDGGEEIASGTRGVPHGDRAG